jgi:hypothetical protein
MDYIDWCSHVFRHLLDATIDSPARTQGIMLHTLASTLPLDEDNTWSGINDVQTALMGLESVKLVEIKSGSMWRVLQTGRARGKDLSSLWSEICQISLDHESELIVRSVSRLERKAGSVQSDVLFADLGWPHDLRRFHALARELEEAGMAELARTAGTDSLSLTYRGMVWATRYQLTRESQSIDELVSEWETTSVDFKRELRVNTDDEKAEFIKDLLGIVNTKASPPRLLVIGFDDVTREIVKPPDPKITQERLEDIVNHYIEPNLLFRYAVIDYRAGAVGKLEVNRESRKLPYRVAVPIGSGERRRNPDDWFVRHGSKTELPTTAERAEIIDEGRRARGETESGQFITMGIQLGLDKENENTADAPDGFWDVYGPHNTTSDNS